jgi:hypothetical protein
MKSCKKNVQLLYLVSLTTLLLISQSLVTMADCLPTKNSVIRVKVRSCEKIVAENNSIIQQQIEKNPRLMKLYKDFYTGAIVTADILPIYPQKKEVTLKKVNGFLWLYPSMASNPCEQFSKNMIVKKNVTQACCDAGSFDPCLLGGRLMWDINRNTIVH